MRSSAHALGEEVRAARFRAQQNEARHAAERQEVRQVGDEARTHKPVQP